MKKTFLLLIFSGFTYVAMNAQCNVSNATTCVCDSGGTNCDLLPDITISWYALQNYMSGPSEYSQTGNGVNNGRLRVTGSTPNIGHGPLTVQGTTYYTCGTDTFSSDPGNCPDGSLPKHLIKQRIYHKNGNTMTYNDRWAGSMTYHPTHGHDHVDDWDVLTLRLQDPNEPDPRNWPIVGTGSKLGFCLMDYYKCTSANATGMCRDTNMYVGQGTVMNTVAQFPNDNLGGGNYYCSQVQMGISSGWTDVYDETLDGMWINIPPGTCNGQYWIVSEVDKPNSFIEEDETNNWTAIPFTLTLQSPSNGGGIMNIHPDKVNGKFCSGDSIQLTADAATNYLWSNSATTQSIWVTNPGNYTVIGTNYCGTLVSSPFKVSVVPVPPAPTSVTGDTICYSGNATLNASGSGTILWYNNSGQYVGNGNTFTTPTLTTTTTYWAENIEYFQDTAKVGPADTLNTPGSYASTVDGLIFDVHNNMNLISVKVYANNAGSRTFEVRDSVGGLVQTGSFNLPAGPSRVTLNWAIPKGNGYVLKCIGSPDMFRAQNTNEIMYPYTITDVVSIVNSTASGNSNQYYFYFYDWEVEHSMRSCSSAAVPVDAYVNACIGIASVKDQSNNIKIYPNPAKDVLNVEMSLPGNGNAALEIFDVIGKSVYAESLGNFSATQTKQVNISQLNAGVYFVQVRLNGKSYFKRLVKE